MWTVVFASTLLHFKNCSCFWRWCHNACVSIRKKGLMGPLNVRNILPISLGNSWHSDECSAGLQRDKAYKCCIVGIGGLRFVATGLGCLLEEEWCVCVTVFGQYKHCLLSSRMYEGKDKWGRNRRWSLKGRTILRAVSISTAVCDQLTD